MNIAEKTDIFHKGCEAMNLFSIQESVQGVAEAISAILNIDVTIVDRNLTRVAATGAYRHLIGEKLPKNCSFEFMLERKEPEFIGKPNISEKCTRCSLKGNCTELATIGYPILSNEELLGIIGLIAFNTDQKRRIYSNYDSLIAFLGKLGELLAGNLKYIKTITELTIQSQVINMIINGLENGIICTDNQGNIKFVNSKVEHHLKIRDSELINKSIHEIIPITKVHLKNERSKEIKIVVNDKRKSFIIKNIPVIINSKRVGNIIEICETYSIIADVYRLIRGWK